MSNRDAAPDPIIVTGVPRSGTRMMAAILDAHPQLASGPDLPFLITMAMQWREIATTLGANHARHHHLEPDTVRNAFRSAMLALFENRLRHEGKERFVIQSFAAMLSLDALAAVFPAARFVLMMRDPRDVATSLQKCDWRNPHDGSRLPYTRDAGVAARLWRDMVQMCMSSAVTLKSAGRLHVVRYEDLCANAAPTLARLGEFLGVTAPAPLVTDESATCVVASNDNEHPPLRPGPISPDSVGSWRSTIRGEALAAVNASAFPLAGQFGYAQTPR